MRKVKVQNVDFGKGMPKIAIPLTGERLPALYEELEYVRALPADLLEWRADYYLGNLLEVPSLLRENVGEKPLLCTVRTRKEGGQAALTPEEYEAAVTALIGTGKFDLVDLELSCGQERLLRLLRLCGAKAVLLAGADGYKPGTPAYADSLLHAHTGRGAAFNTAMAGAIKACGLDVTFITPSEYAK